MPDGRYIVIEGNDGTGKSTQVEKIREKLKAQGIESIEFHEPAGVAVADAIREIIKNGSLERDGETNLLLFTAARHEIWKQAQEELAKGKWVVAARNYYSTLAYQGYGEKLPLDLIIQTTKTFTHERYMMPDLAVILSIDEEVRYERIAERGDIKNPDTFESRSSEFQFNVDKGYVSIANDNKLEIIDASQTIEEVTEDIWKLLFKKFNL